MIVKDRHTLKEIKQQPDLWLKVFQLVNEQKENLNEFLKDVILNNESEVIFTGAGSSFFIGEMVAPFFQKDTGTSSRAVETTEIVTHPDFFINKNKVTLLVSFARSGNSPESVAALNLANKISQNIKHLIITCNKDGALAKIKGNNVYSVVLPEEANDKSLAMTSSVTSMGIAALLIGRLDKLDKMKQELNKASVLYKDFFSKFSDTLREVADTDYQRAVFLGSGPMKGVAHEAHLKLQELTDGEIISKFDSFMGFRHGPKAVVNAKTLLVYFFSNDSYSRKYEYDLVQSIYESGQPALTVAVSNVSLNGLDFDLRIDLDDTKIDDGIWTITSLVPIQLLAYYKSEALGYNPDSPSKRGAIHRVVQGVSIYDYESIDNE